MNEVIFESFDNIMLSDDLDAFVSFPQGWVHMRLDGTMGDPAILIVAIYAGKKQTIRLEEGKSFKLHGNRPCDCYEEPPVITVEHVKTEDHQGVTCVYLKGGPAS